MPVFEADGKYDSMAIRVNTTLWVDMESTDSIDALVLVHNCIINALRQALEPVLVHNKFLRVWGTCFMQVFFSGWAAGRRRAGSLGLGKQWPRQAGISIKPC